MQMENYQFVPGDIIQAYEEPIIKCLKVSFEHRHCFCCFKYANKLQRCGGCKTVFYCNKNCQKIDWKTAHSIECKLYGSSQISIASTDAIRQIIRLMSFLKLHGERAKKYHQLYDGSSRCFNDLVDNHEAILKESSVQKICTTLALILDKTKLFSPMETSYENLVHLHGVWKTNAFGVSNEENTTVIGAGLYILSTSYDHACRPNALRVIDDLCRMEIRCIDPIRVGVPPKITYLAGIRERDKRQEILKERYHFTCECSLCETEKVAPVTNYKKLFGLQESLTRETFFGNEQLDTSKIVVQNMQNIFCNYDERITNFCDTTLEKLVVTLQGPYKCMVTVAKVKEFAKEVEDRLRITFGVQHKDYQYFIKELLPRLQKAK